MTSYYGINCLSSGLKEPSRAEPNGDGVATFPACDRVVGCGSGGAAQTGGGLPALGLAANGLQGRPKVRELDGANQSFYERDKRLRNRNLRDRIRAQPDVGGILELVVRHGEFWDAVGLSTALHTAALKCREGAGRPDFVGDSRWFFFRELVRVKLVHGEARNLANNVWSLASMACLDRPLLGEIAEGLLRSVAELKVQEVSNSCWAFATVKWFDEPLFSHLADEMMTKAPDGVNQDITNTLWAFATVPSTHEPMFEFLCAQAKERVIEFKAQELANSIWAMATAALKSDALAVRVSRQSLEIFAEFRTQNLANFVWAYAKLAYSDEIVVRRVQGEALRKLSSFSAQDLSTTVWAFSTMPHRSDRFLKCCVGMMRDEPHDHVRPQHLSNLLWAMATVPFHDIGIFSDLTGWATQQLAAFKPQELSNIVWACATAAYRDQGFIDSVTREAVQRLHDFDPQGIGNTVWAVSSLRTSVVEVYDRVWGRLGDASCLMHCSDKVFSMIVLAFFLAARCELAWKLLDRVMVNRVNPGVAAFGTWLHHCCHRRPDAEREIQVLLYLAKLRPCRHLIVAVLNVAAMRLDDGGWPGAAQMLVERLEADRAADAVSQIIRERLAKRNIAPCCHQGGGPPRALARALDCWRVPTRVRGNPRCDYDKECQLLRYVLAKASRGDPVSVIDSIEQFSIDGGGWLKIAGDEKGAVLDDLVQMLAPSPPARLLIEFGCYVGYSSCRMARIMQATGGRIISVEVDPVHACIARSVLEFAGLSDIVSIHIGYSEVAIPQLPEICGGVPADVVFMDQRGTRFHIDLQALEAHGLVTNGCVVAADNCLKPGAPEFLWYLQTCGRYETTVVSLREFAAERIEDWMCVAAYRMCDEAVSRTDVEPPESLPELAFLTDRVRARSCAGDSPGEVDEDTWACHSQDVRRAYGVLGIRPRIVRVCRGEGDAPPFVDWNGTAGSGAQPEADDPNVKQMPTVLGSHW